MFEGLPHGRKRLGGADFDDCAIPAKFDRTPDGGQKRLDGPELEIDAKLAARPAARPFCPDDVFSYQIWPHRTHRTKIRKNYKISYFKLT